MEFLGDGWTRARRRHLGGARARGATSPTPRSWPGWPSTGPSRRPRSADLEGPLEQWKECARRSTTRCATKGFNADKGSFTQYYGSDQLDASLLMIPLVGFLPAHDPRVRGTIEAIERELVEDGFVLRYRTADTGDVDGLTGPGGRLPGLLVLAGRLPVHARADHDARQLLDRLLGLRNDLGLLSEEYDPVAGRLVGNFPQAFSHVSLVNSASKIGGNEKPTSGHVIAGLARRSLTQGEEQHPGPRMPEGSRPGACCQAGRRGDCPAHPAARVVRTIQSAVTPARSLDRGKPTTKPSARSRPSRPPRRRSKKPAVKAAKPTTEKAARRQARRHPSRAKSDQPVGQEAHREEGSGEEGHQGKKARPRRPRPRRRPKANKAPRPRRRRPRRPRAKKAAAKKARPSRA